VTIIPRGRALGVTMQLPTEDKYTFRKKFVEAQIAILMGGRVAEELTQDDITTGAGNDIERATDLARRMVCEWGMSELGPLTFGGSEEPVFLGRDFAERSNYSEDTAIRIDNEVHRFVDAAYQRARAILTEQRAVLDRIAEELLVKESIEGELVYAVIEEMTGKSVRPPLPKPARSREVQAPQVEPEPSGPSPEPSPAPA
jgi:cell division protease FtsH